MTVQILQSQDFLRERLGFRVSCFVPWVDIICLFVYIDLVSKSHSFLCSRISPHSIGLGLKNSENLVALQLILETRSLNNG